MSTPVFVQHRVFVDSVELKLKTPGPSQHRCQHQCFFNIGCLWMVLNRSSKHQVPVNTGVCSTPMLTPVLTLQALGNSQILIHWMLFMLYGWFWSDFTSFYQVRYPYLVTTGLLLIFLFMVADNTNTNFEIKLVLTPRGWVLTPIETPSNFIRINTSCGLAQHLVLRLTPNINFEIG